MTQSLKRRLTASVIAIFIISWLLSALGTTLSARLVLAREMDHLLESILQVTETVGKPFLAGELSPLQEIFVDSMEPVAGPAHDEGTPENPAVVRLKEGLLRGPLGAPSVNIWVSRIQLLVGENTPAFAHPRTVPHGEAMDQEIDGAPWRVVYRHDADHDVWYAVGIAKRQAQFDGSQLLLQMLLPLTVIIPLTVLALYFGIARGLRPLRLLAREIEDRRESRSLEPVPHEGVPQEVEPVVDALNHLLARLADTLENEQRFTANAAHELQTPLAAITTEVQLCQRLLADGESRQMMNRVYARVQRAAHSVRQLLVLARLDPQASLPQETLNLCELAREVVSELGHIASERRLNLDFDVSEHQLLRGNREALLILLRNLVNNAFRYTPSGGAVRIASLPQGLVLENDSDPIANPDRLTERFYRGEHPAESGAEPGTGLGLSIVKRICELHGFRLDFDYRAGRFAVTVRFPS